MFPVMERQPAEGFQGIVFFTIALLVPEKFCFPPLPVVFRYSLVNRASMPKTAVDEYRKLGTRERDIRRPREAAVVHPESESSTMQLRTHRLLDHRPGPRHLPHLIADVDVEGLGPGTGLQPGDGIGHVPILSVEKGRSRQCGALPATGGGGVDKRISAD